MSAQEQLYTVEEFLKIAAEADDRRLELIEGEIVEMSRSQAKASTLAALIVHYLWAYALEHDAGYVCGAECGYKLSEGDFFAPDASFISKARLPEGLPDDYYDLAPDLAIEVVSPTDSKSEVHEKAMRYLALGTKLVWVFYPKKQNVRVYRPAETGIHLQEVDINGTLSGEDVLPGFTLAVKQIYR